uniref:Envelope polyprotein n=1 Tax=Calidris pygmaea TaxID=425635 RepID=A0A8C3PP08_9CHAR
MKAGILLMALITTTMENEHQPFNWTLGRWEDSIEVQYNVTAGPPEFQVKLEDLVFYELDPPGRREKAIKAFYLCPSSNPGKSYCNLPNHYYCAYWGCETIASNWDVAIKDRFLNIIWGPRGCNPPARSWDGHIDGPHLGNFITKRKGKKKKTKVGNSIVTVTPGTSLTFMNKVEEVPRGDEPLWTVMQAAYQALNTTNPNFTTSCWLCYDIKPPFYEGIAVPSPFNTSAEENPSRCNWRERKAGVTLQQVRGSGWCVGKVTNGRRALCNNQAQNFASDIKWILPSPGAWWVCSITGLTPCLSTAVLKKNASEFCVQVTVIPRILLHGEEAMYLHWSKLEHKISKREPISAVTVATLLGLGVTGTATGITSLVHQQQKKSISYLEKSLTSLSEVVLQNRRGLDLLFLQSGGLCAALGEECCFFADHTGVVRDLLAKLREGLEMRKQEREAQSSWYESWFNQSPWLTTLISTLAGPLVLLILALTFGPFIINKLVTFVKSRLEKVQLMVMKQSELEMKIVPNENPELDAACEERPVWQEQA